MSRLSTISQATRPKMWGRAMISGPSGAGKTWTSLSLAQALADGGKVLLIDTEKESALTYADSFEFDHLPWRPPYDPSELTQTLKELGDGYTVVVIDSLSKFWRGVGGTLDIADGKFGGWRAARPAQEAMIEAVLHLPAHVILAVRSKMAYAVEEQNGKQKVSRMGLAPQQDDDLMYEMNVAFDIDLDHRLTVSKSRTPAVPVGRMYPAGHEKKAAEDYASWLAGGVPLASQKSTAEVVAVLDAIPDEETRKRVKGEFVAQFGMPQTLTAESVKAALAWAQEHAETLPGNSPETPTEAPEMMGEGQKKRLFAMCKEAEIGTDKLRKQWASTELGRDIESFNDLTKAEASTLIEKLAANA